MNIILNIMNFLQSIIGTCVCNTTNQEENIIDKIQDKDIEEVKQDIRIIKENHLHHIEKDISELKTDVKLINSALLRIEIKLG